MAGDCHMGTGQNPCCKTVSSATASVVSVQPILQIHPDFAVVAETVDMRISSVSQASSEQIGFGLSPPAQNSILRI